MSAGSWSEVSQAKAENRYELVLSGADVSRRISEDGLDLTIFSLTNLNFLEISKTGLTSIPDHVGQLNNLTHLVLHSNNLTSLPITLRSLTKLRSLDVSLNALESLPDEVRSLFQLLNLNVCGNKLKELPSLNELHNLVTLDVSQNDLEAFPLDCTVDLSHLSEIKAKANKIESIPSGISGFSSLKLLYLEENALKELPGELGDCGKIKDLNLKGNPLKDRRLKKLVEQCGAKQVLDYARVNCKRTANDGGNEDDKSTGDKNKKKKPKGKKKATEVDKIEDMMTVLHLSDSTPHVTITDAVREIRPHIVICIMRDVDLQTGNKFKKFIALQTRLHENECDKRNAATIATHDLVKINGHLTYDAQPPEEIKLIPLMRQNEVTAESFYSKLRQEADALRKEKKRNTFSGIHKYLYLLEGKSLYPCLTDSSNLVISFPPITNCDGTKISTETRDVLIEVTSSTSLAVCKKVMELLLVETLRMGIGQSPSSQADDKSDPGDANGEGPPAPNYLSVEQVKIVDKLGQLRSVYPSRTDLQIDGVKIIRSFDN